MSPKLSQTQMLELTENESFSGQSWNKMSLLVHDISNLVFSGSGKASVSVLIFGPYDVRVGLNCW